MYGLQRTDVAGIKKPAVRKNSGLFDVNFSKSLSLFNIVSVPKSIKRIICPYFTDFSGKNKSSGQKKLTQRKVDAPTSNKAHPLQITGFIPRFQRPRHCSHQNHRQE